MGTFLQPKAFCMGMSDHEKRAQFSHFRRRGLLIGSAKKTHVVGQLPCVKNLFTENL